MALSHATGDFDPETSERGVEVYRRGGTSAQVRSRAEFTSSFKGLELVAPGIELAARWHPKPGEHPQAVRNVPSAVIASITALAVEEEVEEPVTPGRGPAPVTAYWRPGAPG